MNLKAPESPPGRVLASLNESSWTRGSNVSRDKPLALPYLSVSVSGGGELWIGVHMLKLKDRNDNNIVIINHQYSHYVITLGLAIANE